MDINRRKFISTSIASGLATTLPLAINNQAKAFNSSESVKENYSRVDKMLKQPVFKRELFSSPVIIDTLELLRYRNSFLCRVRSKDGAEGISVGHGWQLRSLYPIFNIRLRPFFINKTLRDKR